jgi:hypothetical protein
MRELPAEARQPHPLPAITSGRSIHLQGDSYMLVMKHGQHVHLDGTKPPIQSPFEYLLPELKSAAAAHLPGDPAKVTNDLTKLGEALIDSAPPAATDAVEVNSTIPAVYTYWGQFIDHDMTANTDRPDKDGRPIGDITKKPLTPIPADQVPLQLVNLRRPTFDLDSVYGNGPELDEHYPCIDAGGSDAPMYDGIRMRVGANTDRPGIPGVKIPPVEDLSRDLPRIGPLRDAGIITLPDDLPDGLKNVPEAEVLTRPFIGDLRNDENLIVAQFHLAVLRFHNKVAHTVEAAPESFGLAAGAGDAERFDVVQRLVRYHYQWLVINDYLRTVTLPGIVDKLLIGGTAEYRPLPDGRLFSPLEYSVAAFRFGHSMVRAGYDHNRNFGAPVPASVTPVQRFASFEDLFRFTGNGHALAADITKSTRDPFRGLPTLPFNWIIEWDRMTNKSDPNEGHFARKIDTRLSPPILNMVNEGTGADIQDDAGTPIRKLLRGLAVRNLLRGYLLSIPTGQAVADAMGVDKLTEAELRKNNSDAVNLALQNGGFLVNTPLWFYILKEAEVRADGNSLGELGSRIVVETQLGIMQHDPNSYLNDPAGPWDPSKGVQLPDGDGPIVTIRDLFKFADLAA